eukprot:XP_012824904.1 PREDICTED: Fc receptor-like protein 2 isoform X2 [Xenopus tropicalis]
MLKLSLLHLCFVIFSDFYLLLDFPSDSVITCSIAGAAGRATVSFSPNWASAFTSESVTLTCNVAPSAQGDPPYSWYKDGVRMGIREQNYTIVSAQVSDSGEYQCKSRSSDRSEAVTLTVSNGYLTLKVPPFVFEGDYLEVSCAGYPGYEAGTARLYKGNDTMIGSSSTGSLWIGAVAMATSGCYTCYRRVVHHGYSYEKKSDVYISVKELFSKPKISVNSGSLGQINEGDPIMFKCDTNLSPRRETTELQFAFYRNGHNVQGFSLSNQYGVPSAQLEDSGNYTCEVQTPTGSVRKRSNMVHIHIQELFSYPQIKVSADQVTEDHVTITCDTELRPHRETTELQFAFYRNGHNVQGFSLSNQYGVPSAQLEDSGNYTCEVQTPTGSVRKRSREAQIHIQELFPYPQIKVSPNQVREGDHMTITCDTELSPHRETTELQFAFYRNGHNVQGFNSSNQYGVPSAQLEDSGNYTCEAQTPSGSVKKTSDPKSIQIKEPVADARITPGEDELAVIVEDNLCLTCSVAKGTNPLFLWIYNNETIGHESVLYQVRESGKVMCIASAQLQHAGTYWCQVSNKLWDNRIFTVTSNIVTISISEKSHTVMGIGITLAFLVLLLVTAIVAFTYRSRTASSFTNCRFFPRSSGGSITKAQYRSSQRKYTEVQQEPNDVTPSAGQPEYGNILTQGTSHGNNEGYVYIDINHKPIGSSPPINKNDEGSVVYAIVQSKATRTSQNHGEPGATIYENFSAK